ARQDEHRRPAPPDARAGAQRLGTPGARQHADRPLKSQRSDMKWLLALFLVSSQAFAQGYPSKPVRLVVGFAPAGAADVVARTLQAPLQRALRHPAGVDTR